MIDIENLYKPVAKGMKAYVGCPVIRSNQNQEPPAYPYISYTIITPAGTNKGTYGEYDDGKVRKPSKPIISFTSHSDDDMEALKNAQKGREWLDYAGLVYLGDNGVIVEAVGNVGQRSNLLTAEYQHSYGFDATFWAYDEIEMPEVEVIEGVDLGNGMIEPPITEEELNEMLERRLDGK